MSKKEDESRSLKRNDVYSRDHGRKKEQSELEKKAGQRLDLAAAHPQSESIFRDTMSRE